MESADGGGGEWDRDWFVNSFIFFLIAYMFFSYINSICRRRRRRAGWGLFLDSFFIVFDSFVMFLTIVFIYKQYLPTAAAASGMGTGFTHTPAGVA